MTTLPTNITLEAVKEIAAEGGDIALKYKADGLLNIKEKGIQDRVTEADLAVEKYIKTALASLNDEIGFMGEEGGLSGAKGNPTPDYIWVVDPIDGTENYWRGIDHWSVSIALVHKGKSVLGVVYLPSQKIWYSAQLEKGAWKNNAQLHVSKTIAPTQSMIAIGISGRVDFKDGYLDILRKLNDHGIEHRRFGSAAYSLCQVAEGIVEGYWETHLNPWDGAAGMLIAQEAGAYIAPFDFSDPNGTLACAVIPALKPYLDLS